MGTDLGYSASGRGLSVPAGHGIKALISFSAADLYKPIWGASRASAMLQQSTTRWRGVMATPSQAPMPASPYLAPPRQLPHHLAHCLP